MSETGEMANGDHMGGLLQIRASPGCVAVAGELDMATAPLVHNALQPFIRTGGRLRIDLRDVTFIDSSGLDLLAATAAALGTTGRVVVIDPSPVVRRLIDLDGRRLDIDVADPGHHKLPRRSDCTLAHNDVADGRYDQSSHAATNRMAPW